MLHVWQGSKYANVRSHFGSFLSAAYGFVFICLPVFEHFIWAFCLRQLMERSKERGINCHYHFADFKSVFDTIWRKQLSKMMRSISICYKIVNIIENMYEKVTCAVVVDGLLIEQFCVSVRVRQGCLLSPIFSVIFLDFAIDELKCVQAHVTLDYELKLQDMHMILP